MATLASFSSSHWRIKAEKHFFCSGSFSTACISGADIKYYLTTRGKVGGKMKEKWLYLIFFFFISLFLQVPSLPLCRQALCQSCNQVGICPNLYWLGRPLHFLLRLSSVFQLWNSIYQRQEWKKAWKPKLISCCQVGALWHSTSYLFISLSFLEMLFCLNSKCKSNR